MASFITEILVFEASDVFIADPDLPIPAFDLVLKENGVRAPVYYGKQIESPGTRSYVFLNWDSYKAHQAVVNAPSYANIIKELKPSLSDPVEMYHVQFSAPTIALDKPVTEVVVLTLRTPGNREAVVEILSNFSEQSGGTFVFGQTREDENKFFAIGGWETVEAHLQTAARPEVAAALEKLFTLANQEYVSHTHLAQHRLK